MGRNRKCDTDVTPKERFCLDGYIINGDADSAYTLSRDRPSDARPDMIHKIALRWLRTEPIAKYIEQRRVQLGFVAKTNREEQPKDYRNKDTLIEELSLQADSATSPKEKSDILMKIADLQRMKSGENKDETELVHFYLPLTCKRCSLYVAEKKKKESEKT